MICECEHAAFLHKYGVCTAWPCDCTNFREARNDKAESTQGIHANHHAESKSGVGNAIPNTPPIPPTDTGGISPHVSMFVDLLPERDARQHQAIRYQVPTSAVSPL